MMLDEIPAVKSSVGARATGVVNPLKEFVMLLLAFGAMPRSTPADLRQASRARWLELPESFGEHEIQGRAARKKAWEQYNALHPDSPARLGLTRKQRSAEVFKAAELGNITRLELLLQAGADIEAVDLYGLNGLHYAAWHGHAQAANVLLKWGADPEARGLGGSSPLRTAIANGHAEVLAVFGISAQPAPEKEELKSKRLQLPDVTALIPRGIEHIGAGSFSIDNAFGDAFLEKLTTLYERLQTDDPSAKKHGYAQKSNTASRRTFYCDTEGWLRDEVASALQQSRADRKSVV